MFLITDDLMCIITMFIHVQARSRSDFNLFVRAVILPCKNDLKTCYDDTVLPIITRFQFMEKNHYNKIKLVLLYIKKIESAYLNNNPDSLDLTLLAIV